MELIKFYKQKRILHKYVGWMYELLIDGRFYNLEKAKKIKDLPKNYQRGDGPVKRFERMYECSSMLKGYANIKTGEHHITGGFTCGDRVCPVCAVRKAIREYSKLNFSMEQHKERYTYYFLTLTLPNNPCGFRDEILLMNSILPALGDFIGYDHHKDSFRFCEGIYGSYEITKSEYGWHPHVHLVLAYPTEYIESTATVRKVINGRERVFENGLKLRCGKRELTLSQDSIMNRYIELVQSKTNVYDERLEDLRFLNIGFQPCYNIDNITNEMSKYLIDFMEISNADDLYVYMRDSYHLAQRVKRGCFKQGAEFKEAWKKRMDERSADLNKNFIQSEETEKFFFTFKRDGYHAWRVITKTEPVPYTNKFKEVYYAQNFLLVPDPGGGTLFWDEKPSIKLTKWIDKC